MEIKVRTGIEIDGDFYPWTSTPAVRAATQTEIDAENAQILAAVAAGEYVG